MRFQAAVVVALSGLAPSCSSDCDVDACANAVATDEAVQCGHFTSSQDTTEGVNCALAAQQGGKPFTLHLDLQGIDSFVAEVFARTPSGKAYWFQYDSMGATWYLGGGTGRVSKRPCSGFALDPMGQSGPTLTCEEAGEAVIDCK